MAPSHSRQLLIWTLPTIAVLLGYFWYKRKRTGCLSDPGDIPKSPPQKTLPLEIEETSTETSPQTSPNRSFSRSLSGVDSAPIDIVIPPKLKSSKTNPVVISDEDLDLEIEKIKSMRLGVSVDLRRISPREEMKPNTELVTPVTINSTENNRKEDKNKENSKKENNKKENNKKEKQVKGISTPKKSPKNAMTQKTEKLTVPVRASAQEKAANNVEKTPKRAHDELQKQNSSGRDSANHSPADVMLASPSLSSISDNHSEGSNDSGKGGSDVATPPPSRTPVADGSDTGCFAMYEFVLPQTLVGKLIGKHGSFVSSIKDKTGAHVVVRKHPTNNKMKLCTVEGSQKEIERALKMIRDRFPLKRFPDVTLEQVSFMPQVTSVPLIPDHLYLKLIEGINNDTIVSCMVSPNHLFLQQPTHPTYPNLNVLSSYMNLCYAEADSPLLPAPIPENTVCAAYSVDSWYRATILSTDTETGTSYVKFLDYGGYAYVDNAKLRQIRADFMLLPFQAAECFLANVKPVGDLGWHEDAYNLVAELTKGAIIYTQVVDYAEDGVPLVYCYLVLSHQQQIVFLNQELVNQGFAEWLSTSGGDEASGVTATAAAAPVVVV